VSLVIAPAPAKAASYAVTHWHYSRSLPAGRRIVFGAWEDSDFIGVAIFSRGASNILGKPYGLTSTEVCELTRVALGRHEAAVSQVLAECLRRLKQTNPGLRLVVSFADPRHGHHGGIYQAGNWVYSGTSREGRMFRVRGKLVQERSFSPTQHGQPTGQHQSLSWIRAHMDPNAEEITIPGKHRYLYPLDRGMRRQVKPLAKPYPAAEVSTATRPASGEERQVQTLPAAQTRETRTTPLRP
jgi:hypothetical protein